MHMSVGDVAEWHKKYYPGVPLGSLVPARCFSCSQELEPGDQVVIRDVVAGCAIAHVGEVGVVTEVLTSERDGSLFLVRLSSGKEVYFIRARLRKLREYETRSSRVSE
jgi:hypothetical protein